ncbi:tetratricopeptide repeat protein [Roseateles sp.]|uniref:tetratricopeptide repeat protein n=1 Tax=Roseateles sp. TaxID=1971397 RepID=UPI003266BAFB
MPLIGGLHILIALLCAVHVVRSGQQLYWLFILFAFPLLGSAVYFFAIYLPNSRLDHGARKAVTAAARAMDPGRDVREARVVYDVSPSAQNQMRLAEALLNAGEAREAAELYEGALKGPFANDPDLRFGAVRAYLECQRFDAALSHLLALKAERPEYRPDQVLLLLARCYAGVGRQAEARESFEAAVQKYGSFEAHAEYSIWALATGDAATAARLQTEIDRQVQLWTHVSRQLNEPVMRRLKAAHDLARKGG